MMGWESDPVVGGWEADPVDDGRKTRAAEEQAKERSRLQKELIDSMSGVDKFLAGTGKAFSDIGRGAGQMVGLVSRGDVADSRQRDKPLMDSSAGFWGNIFGNTAALAPAALIPGVNTIAGGGLLGAGMGFLQPSASTSETATNTGIGLLGGAIVPAATRAWQAGKALVEPFTDKGKEAIIGRAITAAAGNDSAAVQRRLAEAGMPFVGPQRGTPRTVMGEFVPGSVPTAGQAAENAGVAALERSATATNPNVTNAVTDILRAQNNARTGALRDLAGSGGKRDFFAADRASVADRLYGEARRLGVDQSKLTPEVLENIASFSRRVPDAVLSRARELAQIAGDPMTDATSVQGMHWLKMGIDDMIGSAKRSGNSTLERALVGLQKDMLTGMDNLSPAYKAARKTFEAMSKPINQMDVAGEIASKSINPLTDQLQPAAYARALSDQTAARALKMPGATLRGTMAPDQMQMLDNILLDVQRSNAAQNVGRGPGSDTVQKLAYTNMLDQAGVPSFMRDFSPTQALGNIVGRAGDAAYGRANRELSQMLAEIMLDPGRAAEVMKRATPAQQSMILQALQRGGSGLGLALPATANAQQ